MRTDTPFPGQVQSRSFKEKASIGEAVIATDASGMVTFLNPLAAALTGWTAQEAVGRRLKGLSASSAKSPGILLKTRWGIPPHRECLITRRRSIEVTRPGSIEYPVFHDRIEPAPHTTGGADRAIVFGIWAKRTRSIYHYAIF